MKKRSRIVLSVVALIMSLFLMTIGVLAALEADQLLRISGTITLRRLDNPLIVSATAAFKTSADDFTELTPEDGIIDDFDLEVDEVNPSAVFRFDVVFTETTEIEITLDLGENADTCFEVAYAVGEDEHTDFEYEDDLFFATIALDSAGATESGENYALSVFVIITALVFDDSTAAFSLTLA